MEPATVLYNFMDMVWEDPRIGPSHISLFVAILVQKRVSKKKILIPSAIGKIMKMAKICSKKTYYKCIRDLNDCGYIVYIPSNNPNKESIINLKFSHIRIS